MAALVGMPVAASGLAQLILGRVATRAITTTTIAELTDRMGSVAAAAVAELTLAAVTVERSAAATPAADQLAAAAVTTVNVPVAADQAAAENTCHIQT